MKVSKAQAKKLGLATKEKICEGCGARSETTRRTCRSCGCRMVDNPFPYRLGTGPPHKKPSKYKNVRVMVDGIVFDSKREAKRWSELRLLQFARKIGLVFCQMRYDLHAKGGKKVGVYIADFVYSEPPGGKDVVEDTKGFRTELYKWKKRHMLAEYGIEIRET